MRRLRALAVRIGGFFSRKRWERDLDDEVESNLQFRIDDNLRAGMNPAEARRAAILRLGGVEAVKESYRDERSIPMLDHLRQDFRYAGRSILRSPIASLAVVLLLGLALSANIALFTIVNGLFFRTMPGVQKPESLATLSYRASSFTAIRERMRSFDSMAAHLDESFSVSSGDQALRVRGAHVGDGFFEILGVRAAAGTLVFSPGDEAVIISHKLWMSLFGGENVLGQRIFVDGRPVTILGVTEREYRGVFSIADEIYLAFSDLSADQLEERGWCAFVGRLRPGGTVDQASSEFAVTVRQLEAARPPESRTRRTLQVYKYDASGTARAGRESLRLFGLLNGATMLALLAVCTTLANLLLARAAARYRETAIHCSLGASRLRVVRRALVEGLVLSLPAAVVGMWIAPTAVEWLFGLARAVDHEVLPQASPDWRVAGYAASMALIATLVFALPAALQSTQLNIWSSLRAGESTVAGGESRMRAALTVTQVVLCIVLLTGSGLLLRSIHGLFEQVEDGMRPKGVRTATVWASMENQDEAVSYQRLDRIRQRMAGTHGVESVALAAAGPFADSNPRLEGRLYAGAVSSVGGSRIPADYITPDYFRTLGIPLLSGREFQGSDGETGLPVAIITESLAEDFWPGADPVGRSLYLDPVDGGPDQEWRVVGVVGDTITVDHVTRGRPMGRVLYLPMAQNPQATVSLVIRSSLADSELAATLQREAALVDPKVPVGQVRTLREAMQYAFAGPRFFLAIIGFSALLTMLVALVGIYAIVALRVAQKRREIAVHMALGASSAKVLGRVLRGNLILFAVGATLGGVLAVGASSAVSTLLSGIPAADSTTTILGAIGLILVVVLTASLVPALRALTIQPATVLRQD